VSGIFEARRLRPGLYDVKVLYGGEAVAAVEGVEVPAGGCAEDPRLQGLVIGRHAVTATVLVIDGQGAPMAGALVSFEPDVDRTEKTGPDGRARRVFLEPPERMRVRVSMRGFLTAAVDVDVDDFPVTIRLDAGADVHVRFAAPDGWPRPAGLADWLVMLSPAPGRAAALRDHTYGQADGRYPQQVLSATHDACTLRHVAPGAWNVAVAPRFAPPSGHLVYGRSVSVGRLDVAEGVRESHATVSVGADALKALAEGAPPR